MNISGAIIGGLTLGLFMAISVGPTLFAVIRYSLNHSYKAGLAFVLGVSVSDILYVTLANLATPWLEALHKYEKWLAYIGGGLLAIIGLVGLLSKYKPQRPKQTKTTLSRGHYARIWTSGFLINTINPGVVVNWLGAVTIIAKQGTGFRVIFFSCCLGLVLGIDFLKVFLADSIRKRLTLRLIMYLQKISALCLFGAGLFLIGAAAFGWVDLGE
jgi:threonine/homoserine/homoserine lactone efflux protein